MYSPLAKKRPSFLGLSVKLFRLLAFSLDAFFLFLYAQCIVRHQDTLINPLLAHYNVVPERYEQGLTLCTETYTLEKLQVKLHGEQFRARKKFDKLLTGTHPQYMDHVKFMRMAYRDDVRKLNELAAVGGRVKRISGWLMQSKTFYTNTINDEESLAKMAGCGITKENLEAVEAKVTEVVTAYQEHKNKKSAAQDAIDTRDKALDKLEKQGVIRQYDKSLIVTKEGISKAEWLMQKFFDPQKTI